MLKIRHLLVAGLLLASVNSYACHVDYYNSTGCIGSGTLVIDAVVNGVNSSTYYFWQFRNPGSATWTNFVNGSQTINGQSYTVSGVSGTGSDNPDLTISNPNANLDGVQVRLAMKPSSSSSQIYNGDDEVQSLTRLFRLRYTADGSCQTTCANNKLVTGAGMDKNYGGFEMGTYVYAASNADDYFDENNFGTGKASSDYANYTGSSSTGSGSFKVVNNPIATDYSFASSTKFAPHSGNYQMVVKGNTSNSSRIWYKTVAAVQGAEYTFSAWVAGVDITTSTVKLYAGANEIGSVTIGSTNIGGWVQVSGTYIHTAVSGNVDFSIKNTSASGGADNFAIDDICLTEDLTINIGDFVWWDINRDGIQDSGEPGVSGVTVQVFKDADGNGTAEGGAIATTTTGIVGTYSVTVPRGKYFLKFTLPSGYTGFSPQDAGAAAVSSAVNASGQTGTHDFTSDYNMKDAGLLKSITISGTAFNDPNALIDGIVNGTAISNVSGTALYANLYRISSPIGFVASTPVTAAGTYSFANLAGNINYIVAISTVAASTGSPASTLAPSNWLNTGENIGTGSGSDGSVNGMINVSLLAANIGNVNFGMQQPPSANTATLPAQNNPGNATFVTVPATNFGGVDAGGSISYIKITGFPTNTTTLKVNGSNYVAATVGNIPNIPTNPAGQPTQTIEVDPVDGPVSVVIPYKTIDNGGAQSTNTGSVTVPFSVIPDLTPQIVANPSIMNGITSFNITIRVNEVAGAPTTGSTITVLVPKDPRLTFTYNSAMTVLGTTTVNNSVWSFDNSNPFFYVFTSNTVIPSNGFSTIGLAASFNPQSALGVYVLSSVITNGSGGEVRTNNNSSSVSLNYFPN